MAKMEDTLAQGVKDGHIPHAVVFATNVDGGFTYKHAVGSDTVGDSKPIAEDAVFLLASSTKLMTSIAALQIVERGLFGLDDDVASQLPELAAQPILQGFDDHDKPITKKREKLLTLRHLLTHSSGLVYDLGDPNVAKWKQQDGRVPGQGDTVAERFGYPLVFEPGTAFMYGCSMDWAGQLIERVTKQTLEQFMKENIWEPLGANSFTFFPNEHLELQSRIPGMSARGPDGQLVPFTDPSINTGSKDCFGGHGAYGTMGDYLKVQRSILANDGKLLKPETVEMMFTPQLSPESKRSLKDFRYSPMAAMMIGDNDPDIEADWGIGGILFLENDVGRRKKGTLNWGGMANTFWTIDREADVALKFGTQVLPPGDVPTAKMIKDVELGVYEMAGVKF